MHFKKFELLTHPVCEMFLHMKWVRARWIYYTVMVLSLMQALFVLSYGMLNYGQLGWYVNATSGYGCEYGNVSVIPDYFFDYPEGSLPCIGWWFRIPVMVAAVLSAAIQTAKLIQDGISMFSLRFWFHRPEEFTHYLVVLLISVDQVKGKGIR